MFYYLKKFLLQFHFEDCLHEPKINCKNLLVISTK